MSVPSNAWLIRNATLVNEGRTWAADVRLREGRIDCIGQALQPLAGEGVIEAHGLWLAVAMWSRRAWLRTGANWCSAVGQRLSRATFFSPI